MEKLKFKSPDDVEAVYYEAMRRCDSQVMVALWADGEVVCVHPGSGPVIGYEAVARSWKHMFTNARMPDFEVSVINRTTGSDLAVHLVVEQLPQSDDSTVTVLATNVYRKTEAGWLMVEHHASVVEPRLEEHTLQ